MGRDQGPTPARVGEAAALCYADAESDEAIARRLGIARRTLARWKGRPEFAAATVALSAFHRRELMAQTLARYGLADDAAVKAEP